MNSCILAIECSSDVASLCIQRGGQRFERELSEPHSQAAQLVPALESLLHEANIWYSDLTDLAFSVGPGSFTSIRIGLSVSRTILGAFPNIKAHPFTTLECLAAASPDSYIEARIRAGKGEVYRQFFEFATVMQALAGIQTAHQRLDPCLRSDDSHKTIYSISEIELVPQTGADAHLSKPHARFLLAAMEYITIPKGRSHSPLYSRAPDAKVSSKPPI